MSGPIAPCVCDKLSLEKSIKHCALLCSRATAGHSKFIDSSSSYQRLKVANRVQTPTVFQCEQWIGYIGCLAWTMWDRTIECYGKYLLYCSCAQYATIKYPQDDWTWKCQNKRVSPLSGIMHRFQLAGGNSWYTSNLVDRMNWTWIGGESVNISSHWPIVTHHSSLVPSILIYNYVYLYNFFFTYFYLNWSISIITIFWSLNQE